VVASPDALVLPGDARRAERSPDAEREELAIARLARRWQGSAGGVISVKDVSGRVLVDDVSVGASPASVLLDEGEHTLVVRDGAREIRHETLVVKPGARLERGTADAGAP
jgi:hypothetical protein